jgi:hypothetical protein
MKKKTSDVILPHEVAFLKAGGALGLEANHRPSSDDKAIAAEYKQLIEMSFKEYEVAQLLDVSINQVLERINEGSLYVIVTPSGYVCPPFQFFSNATLPGIEVVLAAVNLKAHPIVVQRFFLTPTADLESMAGHSLSPREWLIQGHSPDPVARLGMEF